MGGYRTTAEYCRQQGITYSHPLGEIAVYGAAVETFPPGGYIYTATECPSSNGRSSSLGWHETEGKPPQVGSTIEWVCSCKRAESVIATVCNSLIITEDAPAVVGGKRSPLWPATFETVAALSE